MDFNREPAAWCLCNFRRLRAKETWDGGTSEVDIKDTNGMTGETERESELGCDGGFTHAAFAG